MLPGEIENLMGTTLLCTVSEGDSEGMSPGAFLQRRILSVHLRMGDEAWGCRAGIWGHLDLQSSIA